MNRRKFHFIFLFDQICHVLQLLLGFLVRNIYIFRFYPCDKKQLLSVMVKGDHLVKKHQVHIPEILLSFRSQLQFRFTVSDIVIRKISNQAAGKCRKAFYFRTFVLIQYLPQGFSRMSYMTDLLFLLSVFSGMPDLHFTLTAGNFHHRVISKK